MAAPQLARHDGFEKSSDGSRNPGKRQEQG
jgi:hypothetical protein